MTSTPPLGQLVHSIFVDHLITVKGLAHPHCTATATRSGCCWYSPRRQGLQDHAPDNQ